MSFDVSAEAYGRFMGRYSEPLGVETVTLLDISPGQRALDVGCGPGALTAALVAQLDAANVSAVEPSAPFFAAAQERFPDVDIRHASAEDLPFDDATFDVTVGQLVVNFFSDTVAGLREMRRVTRSGGVIAASVWDLAGERAPLSTFWRAAREFDPAVVDESGTPGARQGQLVELFTAAGIADAREHTLTVRVPYRDVDEWWQTYTLGVGPAGSYVATLDEAQRAELRARCAAKFPDGPFVIEASAWLAVGRA